MHPIYTCIHNNQVANDVTERSWQTDCYLSSALCLPSRPLGNGSFRSDLTFQNRCTVSATLSKALVVPQDETSRYIQTNSGAFHSNLTLLSACCCTALSGGFIIKCKFCDNCKSLCGNKLNCYLGFSLYDKETLISLANILAVSQRLHQ